MRIREELINIKQRIKPAPEPTFIEISFTCSTENSKKEPHVVEDSDLICRKDIFHDGSSKGM